MWNGQVNDLFLIDQFLQLLFEDLKNQYNIKYNLTRRLNQDILENFFGAIRARGGLQDHFNALEFKYRLRSYILGKNEGLFSEFGNAAPDETPDLEYGENLLSKEFFSDLVNVNVDTQEENTSSIENECDSLLTEIEGMRKITT